MALGMHTAASDTQPSGRIELDAPTDSHAGGDSVQILTDALRSVNRDTLISALEQLGSAKNAKPRTPEPLAQIAGDAVSPRLIKRLAMLALVALTLLEPIASQISERLLSPRSDLASKLDTVLHEQAVMQATILSLAKWVVDVERARNLEDPMPEMPPAVRLILAQDDVARSTGP